MNKEQLKDFLKAIRLNFKLLRIWRDKDGK